VEAFKADPRGAARDEPERALVEYVARLTLEPANMERSDVERLRDAGFDDDAIVEINQVTGFFAWCTRTVQGLGVELEAFWDQPDPTNV
jgi:uncharacterized protein YciW